MTHTMAVWHIPWSHTMASCINDCDCSGIAIPLRQLITKYLATVTVIIYLFPVLDRYSKSCENDFSVFRPSQNKHLWLPLSSMVKFCIAFKVFHSNGLIIINSISVTAESIRIIIVQPLTLQRPLIRPKVIVLASRAWTSLPGSPWLWRFSH